MITPPQKWADCPNMNHCKLTMYGNSPGIAFEPKNDVESSTVDPRAAFNVKADRKIIASFILSTNQTSLEQSEMFSSGQNVSYLHLVTG